MGSFAGGYGGTVIAAWWAGVFQECGHGLQWLDLASGNGALPHLWLHAAPAADATMHACDLALKAPAWLDNLDTVRRARIRWEAGTNAEALPFESGRFDVVTSQYGIEYTDLGISLPEALRMLKTAGRLRLVMHHRESRPVALARIELQYLDSLLDPQQGLLACGVDLIEPYARTATPEGRLAVSRDPLANARRLRFNHAESALGRSATAQAIPEMHAETVQAMGTVLRLAVTSGIAAAHADVEGWRLRLSDRRVQLTELIACALTPEAMVSLCVTLHEAQLHLAHGELHEGPHRLAWWLKADR